MTVPLRLKVLVINCFAFSCEVSFIYLLKRVVLLFFAIKNIYTFNKSYVSEYRISSSKRRASNKRRRLISAALLVIHTEISASL